MPGGPFDYPAPTGVGSPAGTRFRAPQPPQPYPGGNPGLYGGSSGLRFNQPAPPFRPPSYNPTPRPGIPAGPMPPTPMPQPVPPADTGSPNGVNGAPGLGVAPHGPMQPPSANPPVRPPAQTPPGPVSPDQGAGGGQWVDAGYGYGALNSQGQQWSLPRSSGTVPTYVNDGGMAPQQNAAAQAMRAKIGGLYGIPGGYA